MIAALFVAWSGGFASGVIVGGLLAGSIVALAFLRRPQDFADLRQRRQPPAGDQGITDYARGYQAGHEDGFDEAVDALVPWGSTPEADGARSVKPC